MTLLAALLGTLTSAQTAPPRLTRRDAVRLGLERNLGLLVQRLELQRTQQQGAVAAQAYRPVLGFDGSWQSPAAAPSAPFLDGAASLAWKSPWGTSLSASVRSTQPMAQGPSTATAGLSLAQPLLKNAWSAGASLPLREAELGAEIQRELFRAELQRFLLDVETDYWDLALAESDLAIKKSSLERAQAQYDETAENIRRGILSGAELYVVEDNLVFFKQELVRAESTLRSSRRRLAERLQYETAAPLESLVLAETLALPEPLWPEQLTREQALLVHPASAAQRLRVERAEARLAYASQQSLPGLDTVASLGLAASDGPNRSAFGQLAQAPADARVGLRLTLPLDRAGPRAAEESARLELSREKASHQAQDSTLALSLANARAALQTQAELAELAKKQVRLAELKLEAEVDKYKNGLSRLPEVVRFQRELDGSQLSFQRTLRALLLARSQLAAAQGTLAREWGVEVAP